MWIKLIVFMILAGCSSQEWTARDTAWQSVTSAAILADGYSSLDIGPSPYHYEKGPVPRTLFGANPSREQFMVYTAALLVGSYLVARALPPKYRPAWWTLEILVHGQAFANNCDRGLC